MRHAFAHLHARIAEKLHWDSGACVTHQRAWSLRDLSLVCETPPDWSGWIERAACPREMGRDVC